MRLVPDVMVYDDLFFCIEVLFMSERNFCYTSIDGEINKDNKIPGIAIVKISTNFADFWKEII